jgi:ribonuclease HI
MLAVNHALTSLQLPPRAEIHLYTDNQAVLAYLRNWGGTRSKELAQATYLVWDTLLKRHLSLARISYVPSDSNTVADYLSRLH